MTDERKKPVMFDIVGEREVVLEKIGTVKQLADDLGLDVVSQIISFKCDNPQCNFRTEIMPDHVYDFNFCPKCGVKEGTFSLLGTESEAVKE